MDYSKQVERALIYIEDQMLEDISLEDIADVANLSCFHFHRIFTHSTGYSPMDYVRKRRLSCSSRDLVFNKTRLQEIARKYKFQSLEAYIRAFKKEFNTTPGQIRKEQNVVCSLKALKMTDIKLLMSKRKEDIIMEPKIIELPDMKLIGLKCTTTMKENSIPQLWEKYMQVYDAIPDKLDSPCFGICVYMDMDECKEDTPFDYIAAHCVSTFDNLPDNMISYTIPKGKYASFTHKGSLDTLDKTYSYIYGAWVNETEHEMDKRDQIELYDARFKYGQADSEMDILIPIK